MLVALPFPVALAVDVVVLAAWSVLVGWWSARRSLDHLRGQGWLLRLRAFEAGGHWYERVLHVKAWKDRLPEAGTWFGGLSKKRLPRRGEGGLDRYRAECVRAETTHWLAVGVLPVLVLWSPWYLAVAMVLGGVAANAPCIVVPRYNRARVDAALARRRAAQAGPA